MFSRASAQSPIVLKNKLAESSGSEIVGYNRGLPQSLTRDVSSKQKEMVSVFDYIPSSEHNSILDATNANDQTTEINKALFDCKDYHALIAPAGRFNVSNLITYPTTEFRGAGRHRTNFWCLPGTTGKMISDNANGAQKLMLFDMAFYGNNETGLTHVGEFGNDGIQFGTEANMGRLWFRDAPNAKALSVDGNVGIIESITTQTTADGIEINGASNMCSNLIVVDTTNVGFKLSSGYYKNIHVEAPHDNSLPLYIFREAMINGCTLSLSTGAVTNFTHLIEIDSSIVDDWSIDDFQIKDGNAIYTNHCKQTVVGFFDIKNNASNKLKFWTKNLHVGFGEHALPISGIYKNTASVDFPLIPSGTSREVNVSVIGARPNMPIALGVPVGGTPDGLHVSARIDVNDIVVLTGYNSLGVDLNPPAQTYVIQVFNYA